MDANHFFLCGRLASFPSAKDYTIKTGPKAGETGYRVFFPLLVGLLADRNKSPDDPSRRSSCIAVVAWGDLAKRCMQYLHKGDEVIVEGEIISNLVKPGDSSSRVTYCQAESIQFDHALSQRVESERPAPPEGQAMVKIKLPEAGKNPFEASA